MADSENDTLSIKIPDTGANSTQPSDTEGEKEASSAPPVPSVPPPPNGGLKAWLQVAGSFLLVLNTWGLANSFGIFQSYYTTTLLPESNPSAISWIGSIQGFLLLFVGVLCGRAFDAGYFFPVLSLGIFLEVFGMMTTSLSTKYYQIFLAQGISVGLGSGCLFTPAISLVGTYFSTRRSLATGIAASGSSVGGIFYPIVLRRLIVQVGFPWAVRAMAFIMLGTLGMGLALLRPRLPPRRSGPLVDFAAFKDPAYTTFVIGLALGFTAFFIPFFYAESYALNIGVESELSFYILSIMNAGGMIGRMLPNAIADKIGNLNVIVPCGYISGIIVLAWVSAKSQANFIATSFLYSFFSGGLMALPPAVLVGLTPDLSQVGVRVGMALSVGSLGVLIGSPIAGAILSSQSHPEEGLNLSGTLVFTGVVLLATGGFMNATRFFKHGFKWDKA
ncbi:unnamed protein product [Penicillium palitans]